MSAPSQGKPICLDHLFFFNLFIRWKNEALFQASSAEGCETLSWAHRIQAACVPKKAKRRVKTQLSNGVTSAAAVGAPLALVATDGVLEALSG